MNFTLKQLSYFLALAEEQHFGRAAERAHVTQPALSMQIRELEAQIGAQLVERHARGVRLTPTGRDVLARARRIIGEAGELEAAARRRGLSGRINLGVIPSVAPYLLPLALGRLRAADINRDLRLREAQTAVLIEGLDSGRLDAAVVATPAPHPGLTARALFAERFVLAGSAERIAAWALRPEALHPAALDPDHLLLLDEGHCLADQALEVCGLRRRRSRLDLGASSLSTLCGLVAEGFGVTFHPEIAVRAEAAAAPAMALCRFAAPEPGREILLLRRAGTSAAIWFDELATILAEAGTELIEAARRRMPRRVGIGAG